MKVHWIWVMVALWVGGAGGLFVAALCAAAGRADERMETDPRIKMMREQIKEEGYHV